MTGHSPEATTRFTGRRVVVTGGARGIGAGIATRFAREGARVAVLDRLPCGAQLADDLGGSFHPVDLADPVAAAEVTRAAVDRLGGVDVLVTSAGILRLTPLLEIDVDEFDQVFAVNTRAVLLSMQVVARSMIAAGTGGSIVTIASMAVKKGGAREGHYAASKAAVVALTRAAALEWGEHGIRVNAICPGFVLTEMGADTRTEDDVATWCGYSPLGRLGTTDDVAGMATFLASSDASYLTGQALNVTGGMVMH